MPFLVCQTASLLSFRLFSSSLSVRSLHGYKAVNEPVFDYLSGSDERQRLDNALRKYESKVSEVPIVIGDEELTSSNVQHQVRPFDHKAPLAKFYYADKLLLQKAIDASQKAHHGWRRKPLEERCEIFLKAADLVSNKYRMDLLATTMLGQAKTIIQGEIDSACELADFFRFNVQFAMEMSKFQPISTKESTNSMRLRSLEGFWCAIAPFNFTAISGHLAGAPAMMGNVVLWKPSDASILSSYLCFQILREAGVPTGVLNFVPADGPVFGSTVCASPLLAGINFTGSAKTFHHLWQEVANNIHSYRSYPRLIGECGGKNFHFMHSSGNIESVVNGSIRSAFEYGGQKCSACSRAYIPKSLWQKVKAGLLEKHSTLKLGSPTDATTFLSAVIDEKAFSRIKDYLDHARLSPGLEVLAGGNYDDSKGYYIEPTIIETKNPQDRLMQEEIFGPVLTIYPYPDEEYKEILKLIDETSPYALTGAVYAEDAQIVKEASDMLEFATGNFYINDKSTGSVVCQQPFGGARKSGTNDKAGGPHYLMKFVSPQSVKETNSPLESVHYPYMS